MAQQEILLQSKQYSAAARSRITALQGASNLANSVGLTNLGSSLANSASAEAGDFYGVRFLLTPEISESGGANYAEISDIRTPASILVYMGTPSRTFSITGKLFARTVDEADRSWRYINILRSWRMPETVGGGGVGGGGSDGMPDSPTIVNLFGYGPMFQAIPTVMTSLNLEFPSDVDYIRASSGADIPILMNVSISLKEAHQINDITNGAFDIFQYRQGTLKNWS